MKRFLLYLLLLLFVLPLGGISDSYAVKKKATTHKTTSKKKYSASAKKATLKKSSAKKSSKKSYGKSTKYSKKGKYSTKKGVLAKRIPMPVSYNYGSGPKAVLDVKPKVQRVVTRRKGRRIVTYKQVYQPPISLTYTGIDISHHQHQINWQQVATSHLDFVYIKATEGETFRDTLYETNVSRARAYGIRVGSYLYFHPDLSIKRQFENFRDVVREDCQDVLPMIDIEETGGLNHRLLIKKLNELLDLMTDYYGQKPVIYTATSFYNSYLQHTVDDYPLIVGGYSRKPVLLDGRDYVVWQFSSHGKVNGIDCSVDLDVYNTSYSLASIRFDRSKVKGVKIHRIPMTMPSTPTLNQQQKVNLPKSKPAVASEKKKPIRTVVKTVKKKAVKATKKTVPAKKAPVTEVPEQTVPETTPPAEPSEIPVE